MFSPVQPPVDFVKTINSLQKSVATNRSNGNLTDKQKTKILNTINTFEEALEPLKREGTIIDVSLMELLKTLREECVWVKETLQETDEQGPLYPATEFLLNSTDVKILPTEEEETSSDEDDPQDANVLYPLPTPNLAHTAKGSTPMRPALGTPRRPKLVTFASRLGFDDGDLLTANHRDDSKMIELLSEINEKIDQKATAEQMTGLISLTKQLKTEQNLSNRIQELEKSEAVLKTELTMYKKVAGASMLTLALIGGLFGLALIRKSER